MTMKLSFLLLLLGGFLSPVSGNRLATAEVLSQEPESVLEQSAAPEISQSHEKKEESVSYREQPSGEPGNHVEERVERLPEVEEAVVEKKVWQIHGGLVGFYQGGTAGRIEGESVDMNNSAGFGIVADLSMSYGPPVPLLQNGRFFFHIHAGKGLGADNALGGKLFANLNSIADNSNYLQTEFDKLYWLEEAYYGHTFCDGTINFFVGKTEPFVFIDNNVFANDEYTQFVGKPFVNNPVLDGENQFAPIAAASFSPVDGIAVTALGASSSYRNAPPGVDQKSIYSQVFVQPLVAAQLAYSPMLGDRQGNYRVYYWNATYPHTNTAGDTSPNGWGVGLSFDQKVTERLGLFARLGYSSKEAYDTSWFWSLGANLKGIIPSRDKDELGIGIAGLKGTVAPDNTGTELHTELYYRIALTEHFAVSPDLQYVTNPLGNAHNSNVFAGMVRVQFSF
jgi:carbohydrate-selective porin OprB